MSGYIFHEWFGASILTVVLGDVKLGDVQHLILADKSREGGSREGGNVSFVVWLKNVFFLHSLSDTESNLEPVSVVFASL